MDGHLIRFSKTVKLCFIDIESYNLCLNLGYNCAWQVAMINVVGDKIVGEHDIYVKWPKKDFLTIKDEIARLNHYNENKIDEKGILPNRAAALIHQNLIDADYVVAHNGLNFDLYLLRGMFRHAGLDWHFIADKLIDTRAIAQGIKVGQPYDGKGNFLAYQYCMINKRVKGVKTSLQLLAKENDIEFDPAKLHDALYDLRVNVDLWHKLKHKIEL